MLKNKKHFPYTPGRWEIVKEGEITYIKSEDKLYLATVHQLADGKRNTELKPQGDANARLVANAPRMYEELRRLETHFTLMGKTEDEKEICKRIINLLWQMEYSPEELRRQKLKVAIEEAKDTLHKTVIGENQETGEFEVIEVDSVAHQEPLFTKLFSRKCIGIATCSGKRGKEKGELNYIDL